MPVVMSGNDKIGYSPTNMRTRTDDEIAADNARNPFNGAPRSSATSSGTGDPAAARRALAGLGVGGDMLPNSQSLGLPGSTDNVKFGDAGGGQSGEDWRIRVSISPNAGILYRAEGDAGILSVLKNTDGVIFPYVPTVTVSHSARYSPQSLTHTNYTNYFYEASEVQSLSVSGEFTVQNSHEALYFLAAIYFFRATTKMFYGQSGAYQGAPPPMVYLDGYGAHYLPHVPCVVTGFTHTMPADVDYLEVTVQRPGETKTTSATTPGSADSGGVGIKLPGSNNSNTITTTSVNKFTTRVPTTSTISLTLQPVYSRAKQRTFDYGAFARGDLISKGIL